MRNGGCTYCNKHIPIINVNDLATTHPNLVKEWDFTKNDKLAPSDVIAGSGKKVWWRCKRGHSFAQSVINRTKTWTDKNNKLHKPQNCPYCAKPERLYVGFKTTKLNETTSATYYGAICTICGYQEILTPDEMLEHQKQYHPDTIDT